MSDSSTLLVPMYVDALLITPNQKQVADNQFDLSQLNYGELAHLSSPSPSTAAVGTPPVGMNLHWILPAGLRRGIQNADSGQVTYPYAPNRWLVARIQQPTDTSSAPPVKAWVVVSDDVGDDKSSPFVNPTDAANGTISATNIGSSVDIDDWTQIATAANSRQGPLDGPTAGRMRCIEDTTVAATRSQLD